MTKAEIIAAFKSGTTPPPSCTRVEASLDVAERLRKAFFDNKDTQAAFSETAAVFREVSPDKYPGEIGDSMKNTVCLAKAVTFLNMEVRLFGFAFAKAGYFPFSISHSLLGVGFDFLKGFAVDKLTPWNEEFSAPVVVDTAKKLLERYRSIAEKCGLLFKKQSPEDIATAIVNAVNALEG